MRASTQQTTTEPPAFLSVKDAQRYLGGIGRTTLYYLLKKGEIKGTHIRVRGNIRGRRMVLRESLEDYVKRISE